MSLKGYDYNIKFLITADAIGEIEYAKEEAREKGIKIGMQQGIKEGFKEGAKQEKIALAKNLLDILDNKTIAEKTGLNIEEIESLRNY